MGNQPVNFGHDPDNFTYNFSSYKLTDIEKSVFCKALQFTISPNKLEYTLKSALNKDVLETISDVTLTNKNCKKNFERKICQ